MIENPKLVVDVSLYDDHLDVPLLKKAGVQAIIVRSGSGMRRDPKFVQHAQAVVENGLTLMAYHWDDLLNDPTQQAAWAIRDIASTGLPVRFLWMDQEQWWTDWAAWNAARKGQIPYTAVPRASAAQISQHNLAFAQRLKSLFPQSGVYSNYGFVTTWASPVQEWIGLFPLWIAHYGRQPKVPIALTWDALQKEWMPNYKLLYPPGAKEAWIFGHQFTGEAFRLPGILSAFNQNMLTDVSIFSAEFLQVIRAGNLPGQPPGEPEPATPPAGSPEYFVNVPLLNVRKGPGISYGLAGALVKNTILQVDRMEGKWAHVEGTDSWVWAPYLSSVPASSATPPAGPSPDKEIQKYVINVPAVNVRVGPGTQNAIVGKLYKNSPVSVEEIQGDWAHLNNNTWVFAAYVSPAV